MKNRMTLPRKAAQQPALQKTAPLRATEAVPSPLSATACEPAVVLLREPSSETARLPLLPPEDEHAPVDESCIDSALAPHDNLKAVAQPVPVETPMPEPVPEPVYAVATQQWQVMDEAVVGLAHRVRNLPCQDAVKASVKPRPCMVLADGAGSSAVSELGARAVVHGLSRLTDTLNAHVATVLDQGDASDETLTALGLLFVKHAVGLLHDLASKHRRDVRDFRSTLLMCVLGKQRHLWIKVGDGAVVVERQQLLPGQPSQCCLSTVGHAGKGEYANETQFLDRVQPEDVQVGFLPAQDITGLALMSDGAAERLVSNDGQRVAGRLAVLLQALREDKLRRSVLTRMFYEDGFCERSTGDDRALALMASPFVGNVANSQPVPHLL